MFVFKQGKFCKTMINKGVYVYLDGVLDSLHTHKMRQLGAKFEKVSFKPLSWRLKLDGRYLSRKPSAVC